jgi:hypothetical protein
MSVAISTGVGAAIAGVAGAGAGIYGATRQASTTDEALADARAQRAWQQQQYQDYLTRLKPYQQAGTQASGQLSAMLARGNPLSLNSEQVQIPAAAGFGQPAPKV